MLGLGYDMNKFTKYLFFLSLLLTISCIKDKNPLYSISADSFEFYLLADTTSIITQFSQSKLDSYPLSAKPIFNLNDINYYNWGNHSFSIKNNIIDKLKIITKKYHSVRLFRHIFWRGFQFRE